MLLVFRVAALLSAIAAVFLASADTGHTVPPTPMRSSSCVPTWRLATTDSPTESWLSSVVVVSRNDAWAVGAQASGEKPLIAHWNGKAWRTLALASELTGRLDAVAALGPNDVWAFGYRTIKKSDPVRGGGVYRPIAEHWNGRAWESVAMPAQNWRLWSAVPVSPQSLWVGGSNRVLHWDGKCWHVVRTEGAGAITARSDDDVWVAGGDAPSHWDGKHWVRTELPQSSDTPVYGPSLYDIAAAPSTVWAVGDQWFHADENRTEGEIYRWDGAKWSWDFHRDNMSVTAVAAVADDNVWALADSPADENNYQYGPSLPLHWNGARWQVLPRPKAFAGVNFSDLAAASAADMWAVGESKQDRAVMAHYACGQ